MPEATRRAVIYTRLSEDRTGAGAGVARQLEDGRRLAELRGFNVVAEHSDNDISAKGTKRRPGFEATLDTLRNGHADVLIAWTWDRLERNRADTLRVIEIGQAKAVTVALVRGGDLDMRTAMGRQMADFQASIARGEIELKAERQERAGLQAAQEGKPPARRAFGYRQDGTVHPTEGPAVADLFDLYLAGGTFVGLARHLRDNGFTTARGGRWEDTAVRTLLRNPRYAAERYYRGERVALGAWEPLVTAETFAAAQAQIRDSRHSNRRPARRYIGGGLFKCHCGATAKIGQNGDGTRTYICSARKHMQRKAEPVEALVLEVVAERLRRPDVESLLEDSGNRDEVTKLRSSAVALRARLEQFTADYANGDITAGEMRAAKQRAAEELGRVEAALADAGRGSVLASVIGAEDVGAAWLALPLDRQRAVMDVLVDVVILPGRKGRPAGGVFDPDSVRFDWRQ